MHAGNGLVNIRLFVKTGYVAEANLVAISASLGNFNLIVAVVGVEASGSYWLLGCTAVGAGVATSGGVALCGRASSAAAEGMAAEGLGDGFEYAWSGGGLGPYMPMSLA